MRSLRSSLILAILIPVLGAAFGAGLVSCARDGSSGGAKAPESPVARSVAVFVPGVVSGSPIYEQLVAGAQRAVEAVPGASIKVIEAGFNQAEWLEKLGGIAASGEFGLILSSNPALPELCATTAASFPKIRFLVADAWLPGNPAIHTVLYNQFEQAYLVGYLAGLATSSAALPGANPEKKVGMVIAQSYPTLDQLIVPGFKAGLEAAAPGASLEIRTIGNWYDANKAAELAQGLMDAGVDVILPIAGGAGQGVLSAVQAKGRYALWFDGAGYGLAPGSIIGCAVVRQDRLVEERLGAILRGEGAKLFGTAEIVTAAGGYVDFDESGEAYKALPAELRASFEKELAALRSGRKSFPIEGLK